MKPKENYTKFLQLRKEYPFFEYQSYSFELKKQILEISFLFNISNKFKFKPKISIPKTNFIDWNSLKTSDLNNLVFHIGMIELISYWKTTCSPVLIIKPHSIDQYQIAWWTKLYFHGLGEFFYLNGIDTDCDSIVEIKSEGDILKPIEVILNNEEVIVPVGGGKDSVVTLELLKQNNFMVRPMALNPRAAIKRTIESAGIKVEETLIVNRMIDPLLMELNDDGFLNGHTPFSALLAFINLLCSALTGSANIALSNESSANQSTIPGSKINHQYSKTFEFEQDFSNYVKQYIHPNIEYFSFLRPLNELQITALFSESPWHYNGFRSCNVGSKVDEWCCICPKCLFTDIMLSPFLNPKNRLQIFGKNLLDDASLEPIFDELTGKSAIKPFECVGTPEEINVALWKLSKDLPESEYPYLLKRFVKSNRTAHNKDNFDLLMKQFIADHLIPKRFTTVLKQKIENLEVGFKQFLKNELRGIHSLLILGYGKEGRSSVRLFQDYFPHIKLGISDENAEIEIQEDKNSENLIFFTGINYLDAINKFDFIIKSPGIKLDQKYLKSKTTITSQTELFLKYYRDQTIGITGTKGKSTTASLIFHILNKSGKNAVLLGNIGTPAFDQIDQIQKDSIIVYELSAHQLQNVEVSPHIAILLNIFPEHLDHFNSFEQYNNAKLNIGKYQNENDFLITGITQLKSDHAFKSDVIKIDDDLIEEALTNTHNLDFGLKGRHNMYNIATAVIATDLMGVGKTESLQAVQTFETLPHRLEYVGTYHGIKFYNDSISTVPESTIAAVKTLPDVKTLILGGFDRGLDYSDLVGFLKKSQIATFIFIGKAGEKMIEIFQKKPNSDQYYVKVDKLENAAKIIKSNTPKGTICLLSPAAASYDQFHNFEHRGDAFKSLAKFLI